MSRSLPGGFRFTTVWLGGLTDGRNVLALQQWTEERYMKGLWTFRLPYYRWVWKTVEVAGFFDDERESKTKLQATAEMIALTEG